MSAAGRHRAAGATAYITLEPCSQFGRTPPCADALVEAGVARVVVAMNDPNPRVSGQGLQRLREAGIDVRCGLLHEEAEDLNPGFIKRMTVGLPWVRAKTAVSADGRTALPDGTSQWITGQLARDDGHAWRARACAIVTGIGTVRKDNPQMTVRAVDTPRQPLRVVVDTRFEVDPQAAVLHSGHALVATCADIQAPVHQQKAERFQARGIEVCVVAADAGNGKVDLRALMLLLAERGCNEVHLEGGAQLTGAMLRHDLIDEWLMYMAPMVMGEGRPMAAGIGAWTALADVPRWRWKEQSLVGDCLRLRLVKSEPSR